jgi:hypothetical protein
MRLPTASQFRELTITEREFIADRLNRPDIRRTASEELLREVDLWMEWQERFPVDPSWRRNRRLAVQEVDAHNARKRNENKREVA